MNLAQAIMQMYPNSSPMKDFTIRNDGEGQYISEWNLNELEPTTEELQNYWIVHLKNEKKIELNEMCEKEILSGFSSSTNGHQYQFDYKDQENIGQQLTLLLLDPSIENVDWKTEDAGVVTHTRQEFIGIAQDADLHKRGNINKYWTKIAELEATTTEAEIEAIQWEI